MKWLSLFDHSHTVTDALRNFLEVVCKDRKINFAFRYRVEDNFFKFIGDRENIILQENIGAFIAVRYCLQ